ncbi:5-demethoxyubiquinol-8 5-hydroxylase UbiM [Altericroceibacterium endophyticum]|uniref:5-demethoxyubiquinol-8 5-hydroxylase UbiM n=1 Tax=Altericroceibacterium endophyticum TaxID=1808508 RepID=A0A6I4T2J1_9SPHN|nr:5-demethoxyubiquinol-8 5-hydroxylase UbiM [Altericroceibacterium endophyticum]MXO65157.1 5-demethoxyubiquinol-8 5-hydroxylase UbiM [Altericroceibacterium endophyticum]
MYDIVIIGAGPSGLAFACSLAGSGLSIALVDRKPREAIENPEDDGREIALTHHSINILKQLDVWSFIPSDAVSPLREARVLNGGSPFALRFGPPDKTGEALGRLVSNFQIRRALYRQLDVLNNVDFYSGCAISAMHRMTDRTDLDLEDGRKISARLLVGADSRFSWVRDQLGISAEIDRLGRGMLVTRMKHEGNHGGVATEWFDHHQTMAMLPLNNHRSSAVITLPMAESAKLGAMPEEEFAAEVARRYRHRLGAMQVDGPRCLYPLATTWSRQFVKPRAALIGDAAVGMHPVTAHGFNLGLQGQELLAQYVLAAHKKGRDIGSLATLRPYERRHQMNAMPIFRATNLIVKLFTDERPPAWVGRHAALRIASFAPGLRRRVSNMLLAD